MPSKTHVRTLRQCIEKGAAALIDEEALEAVELFPVWRPDHDYVRGDRVRCSDTLYKLIPEIYHSQADHTPDLIPAVWARIDNPAEAWPAWVRPLGAEDAYPAGARVSHGGKHWINTHGDGNVWEPGIYGWAEAETA